MTQIVGMLHQEMLIIALTTLLIASGNPLLSKWRLSKDTKVMEQCLSYVTEMNVNNRHTVAVLVGADTHESYNNAFIQRIINSTNLLIISNKDQMPGAVNKAAMMAKNFTLNKFHHGLGSVMIFFVEISSLSSLHDKLWFIARLTSVFDSRACFIVWHRSGFVDMKSEQNLSDDKDHKSKSTKYLKSFLEEAFKILWKFYIFNAIIVTCQYVGGTMTTTTTTDGNHGADAMPANCSLFTWFPYHKSSRCGRNTENFVEVDRCEFAPNDYGKAFYVNYLNNSRQQIYDNATATATFSRTRTHRSNNRTTKTNSKANDDNSHEFNQKSRRNFYDIRNYFKWEPHGILEFRKISPEDNWHYAKNSSTTTNTGAENVHAFVPIRPEFRHFFNKIPSDLNGCSFRAILFVWPPLVTPAAAPWIGMEHKLFLDLSRIMNWSLEEVYVKLNTYSSSSLPSMIAQNLDADLAFGNLFPNIERYQVMDHSIGYFYDHINWVVPLALDQPVWLNLIHCFGLELWVLIAIVGAVFILLYARVCQLIGNESFSTGVLACVMISLEASKRSLPRNGVIRIILVTWIIYCFHINLMYHAQLTSLITRPAREKQISTPSEIISRSLEFGFALNFAVHFQRINNTESRYFIENNRECTFNTCIHQMRTHSFATLGNGMYVQYILAFGGESAKIFKFKEPIAKSFVETYMKKGFPLRDKLNFLIRRMIEIGYLAGSQNFYWHITRNVSTSDSSRFRSIQYLNLEHFLGAFIVLGIGSSLAFVSFYVEVTTKRAKKSKQKKRKLSCKQLHLYYLE